MGQGSNGTAGTRCTSCNISIGGGGGSSGTAGSNAGANNGASGGTYGGGAGGGGFISGTGGTGAGGAVRIIWPGCSRSFPSTSAGSP